MAEEKKAKCRERLEKLADLVDSFCGIIASEERASHECFVHKDREACRAGGGFRDEHRIELIGLKEALKELAECLEA